MSKTDATRAPPPSPIDTPVQIAAFWKNRQHQKIQVTLKTYEGHDLVDVRQFDPAADGTHRPTTKGIAMSVLRLPELADAITKALAKARELGLLEPEAAS